MTTDAGAASVVIPTFMRKESLPAVIRPVLDDPDTGEVVVVVDGCHDGSYELLVEWAHQDDRVKPVFQENTGEGGARQAGLEHATNDVVVFLDDDVIVEPGVIGRHVAHHAGERHKLVLGYMPTHVDPHRRPGHVPTILYAQDYAQACVEYERNPDRILSHLWAGNMSIRRPDALEIGLVPDVDLGYHADMQFGIRCMESGIKAVFDRDLRAVHVHDRSLRSFGRECVRGGEARAHLCLAFPSLAPEIEPTSCWPRGLGPFQRFLSSNWVRPVSAPLAMGTSYLAGRAHWWSVETSAARMLRQIEVNYGFAKVMQG